MVDDAEEGCAILSGIEPDIEPIDAGMDMGWAQMIYYRRGVRL